jgi:hypothetical protein
LPLGHDVAVVVCCCLHIIRPSTDQRTGFWWSAAMACDSSAITVHPTHHLGVA